MSNMASSSSSALSLKMIDLAELRKEIECDGCQKENPSYRCSRCHGAYYCSIKCQKYDWKNHKHVCQSRDEYIKGGINNDLRSSLSSKPILQVQEQIHGTCSICLQEPMENPVKLPDCHHAFCFTCLAAWQMSSNQCPNCRETTQESVVESALQYAVTYSVEGRLFTPKCKRDHHHTITSGDHSDEKCTSSDSLDEKYTSCESSVEKSKSSNSSHEQGTSSDMDNATTTDSKVDTMDDRQTMYLNLALNEVNRVLLSYPNNAHALRIKGQILLSVEPKQALELLDKAVAIIESEENTAIHDSTRYATNSVNKMLIFMIRLQSCEAMQYLEKYSQVLDIYEELEQQVSKLNHKPLQNFLLCAIFMGQSQCLFDTNEFRRAKHIAECAVRMDRREPCIHTILARAQWALGEKKDAVSTMCRGVLYEAPWDTENQLKNRKYLQGLIDSMK